MLALVTPKLKDTVVAFNIGMAIVISGLLNITAELVIVLYKVKSILHVVEILNYSGKFNIDCSGDV